MRNISLDEKYRVIKDEDRKEIRRRNEEVQKSKFMQFYLSGHRTFVFVVHFL